MRLPGPGTALGAPSRLACRDLISAVVYVSEGRDPRLLEELGQLAHGPPTGYTLIREFRDSTYNRTGYTIAGCPDPVADAALAVSRRALEALDLRKHDATHPRLGVVDHVSLHSLGETPAEEAIRAGMHVARGLGAFGVPVLLYGDLKGGARLAEVRRRTAYFRTGALPDTVEADMGPNEVCPSKGLATVGVVPLVLNYNILIDTDERSAATAVTRSVREKDGGLPHVEALTLKREKGYETACNLLQPRVSTPAMVLERARVTAERLGITLSDSDSYVTGLTEEETIKAVQDAL